MVWIRPSGGSFIPRSFAGGRAFEGGGGGGAEFAWFVLLVAVIVGLSDHDPLTNEDKPGDFGGDTATRDPAASPLLTPDRASSIGDHTKPDPSPPGGMRAHRSSHEGPDHAAVAAVSP
ncbi:hypothetical protein GCM10027575_74960 [Phytohabitans suffuscus]